MSTTLQNGYSADRLRQARFNAHLTQVELARRLRVSPRTIQNAESGANPSAKVRRRLLGFIERTEQKVAV